MNYFWAFVVGGGICVIGQLLIDLTGLTPARILTGYVGGMRRWRSSRAAALPCRCWASAICWRKACGRPSKRKGPSVSSPAG